jgi:hypothetical protein
MLRLAVAALICLAATSNGEAQRLFLNDGVSVAIQGESVRVRDRVVFTLALGEPGASSLTLASLPLTAVDLETTLRYAEALRYHRYVQTRGEADFATLAARVADALNAVAADAAPSESLRIIEAARNEVAGWSAAHYGYRSADVEDFSLMLQAAASELRSGKTEPTMELALVARIEPPTMEFLPPPTLAETVGQVLSLVRVADVPAERIALLRGVLELLSGSRGTVPATWLKKNRAALQNLLDEEMRIERAYTALTRRTLSAASSSAARADVRAVEGILGDLGRRDERLGRKRPAEMVALAHSVETHLEAARLLRLERDQWAVRSRSYRAYRSAVSEPMDQLRAVRAILDDIRLQSGPEPARLWDLEKRIARARNRLSTVVPPAGLEEVHSMLASALVYAGEAAKGRQTAIAKADTKAAREASSAAAAAMMLTARARAELDHMLSQPTLR